MAKEPDHYEQHIQTICLLILTALGITGALYFFKSVLIPFVLAVFLTLSLGPIIDIQMKWLRIPRRTAIFTTIALGCAILALAILLVTAAVDQMVQNRDTYGKQFQQLLFQARGLLPPEWYREPNEPVRYTKESISKPILKIPDPNDPNEPSYDPNESIFDPNEPAHTQGDPSFQLIRIPTNTIRKALTDIASSVMGVISNSLLVVIFMIFLIAGKGLHKAPTGSLWWEVETRIKRYLLTILLTSGFTGLLVGLVLEVLDVNFGWMFGFLAFLLNFIPNIGSIIATILPLPVALIDPDLSIVSKILVLAIPGGIQFTIGNLIQPKLMGESLDLHPIVVLLSLIFFGTIWGIIGMFLAVPITAVVKILLERFGYTRAIAELIAGKTDMLTKSRSSNHE
ncbi:MAG: AI-2E family transporter [Sedimentisphaerales bacterium]|nr:AI-2E family transporter [Sedimentisphaerales bacterium]